VEHRNSSPNPPLRTPTPSEFRLTSLETVLASKDAELEAERRRSEALRADFAFNLGLIAERDAELEVLEVGASAAASREAAAAAELDSCRAALSAARACADAERIKLSELEPWYRSQLAGMRESAEAARHARAEELRGWREQLDLARSDATARLRGVEEEAEAAQSRLRDAAESALMASRREARKRDEDAAAAIRAADERAGAAAELLAVARRESAQAHAEVESARTVALAARADSIQSAAQLDAARGEFELALADAMRKRDAALSSRAGLLEEYERRMATLLDSLRAVEDAFRGQKEEVDGRVKEVTAAAAAAAVEAAAREASLLVRLGEMELTIKRNALAAEHANKAAHAARTATSAAEAEAGELRAALDASNAALAVQVATAAESLQSAQQRAAAAQEEGESAQELSARLRADVASATTRAEAAEGELARVNSAWEGRWQAREVDLRRAYEVEVAVEARAASAIALQLAPALTHERTEETTALESIYSDSAPAVLAQLEAMEAELDGARRDAREARAGLRAARGGRQEQEQEASEVDPVSLQLELIAAHARCTELEAAGDRLRGILADMRAHVDELQAEFAHAQEVAAKAQEAREAADLRAAALQGQLRETASALRTLQQGDAGQSRPPDAALSDALAYKASAEAALGSLMRERDRLAEDLRRATGYVALLQARVQASDGPFAQSLVDEECLLLRTQGRETAIVVAELRAAVRDNDARLAVVAGQGVVAGGAKPGGRDTAALSARVAELVTERDTLLELSNSLRAQLLRARAHTGAPFPRQELRAPPPAPSPALEEALSRVTAQNSVLQADMHTLLEQLVAREAVAAAVPPVPPARSAAPAPALLPSSAAVPHTALVLPPAVQRAVEPAARARIDKAAGRADGGAADTTPWGAASSPADISLTGTSVGTAAPPRAAGGAKSKVRAAVPVLPAIAGRQVGGAAGGGRQPLVAADGRIEVRQLAEAKGHGSVPAWLRAPT